MTTGPAYLDSGLPVAARVADLVGRMTLAEKVGQMDQIVVGRLRAASNPANGDCHGDNTTVLQQNPIASPGHPAISQVTAANTAAGKYGCRLSHTSSL